MTQVTWAKPVMASPKQHGRPITRFGNNQPSLTPAGGASPQPLVQWIQDRFAQMRRTNYLAALFSFDQQTRLPKANQPFAGEVLAKVSEKQHEAFVDPQMGTTLRALKDPAAYAQLSPLEKRMVDSTLKSYEKSTKIPSALVAEISKAESEGAERWHEAKVKADFAHFQPSLEKILDLKKQVAALKQTNQASLYDVMLDGYEEGSTTVALDTLFADLRAGLVPLVQAIAASPVKIDDTVRKMPEGTYPEHLQKEFNEEVLKAMGFDFNRGLLDKAPHPFCSGVDSPNDVRLTTRYYSTDAFSSLSGATHEGGHGLYEQGLDESMKPLGLASAVSLGVHESQSRLWENIVGRSKVFWQHFLPKMQTKFPQALQGVTLDQIHQVMNKVEPSFIRVEADEVTYNLHIMMRYELEKDLVNGTLAVKDLPAAWNKKSQDYLGITPPNDAEGCLQDVHWSYGLVGYFPTYTLGNLLSAQLYRKMNEEFTTKTGDPDYLKKRIAQGEMLEIRDWLREKIHRHGDSMSPTELIQQATGEPLNAKYFLTYLWDKYSEIYPDIATQRPAGV